MVRNKRYWLSVGPLVSPKTDLGMVTLSRLHKDKEKRTT